MITDYTKLPTLLQSRKHWVLCGVPGAADPKHPRQAKHPQWGADSTNPATWADFATASAAVMLDDADGMGYVFAKDDGLVFIDGDHCLGADGRPLPPFNKWLTMLPGYCERSRSGTGLHFIVRGTLPDGCKHKKHINGGEMAVELYDCNRYVALTGDLWGEQTPLEDAPSAQAGINHLLTEAKPHLAVAVDDLDADPFLLNTPGGIVDLRTGELRAPDPAARCTKVTAVAPGSDGAELWWGFLDTVTCGNTELAEYLQTVAGMAVLGKVFTETLLIATGDGGNGKSTFFNTLARVLGDYSTSINPSLLLTGNRGNVGAEVAVLRGVRLALAAETEEGQRLESSTVKRLCSTDRIAANPKYLTPFTFTPSHTLLMFTNFLPRVGSSDKGTWSRLTVLPFNAHLRDTAGERKDYAEVLFTQAGGAVLSWMVEGARRFIANGYKLTPPAVVREALADYRKSCDWLGGFLTECCELGENYATNGRELYARYTAYCQVNGDYRRDNRDFAHAMQNAGYERKHTMKGWQYYGLRLHSELPQE